MMLMPQGVGDDSGLIDYREAARLADLRESDVLRMARQGLFPDFRNIPIGNVTYLLFSRFDVEAWIAAGRPRVSEGREADFRVALPEGDE